MFYAPGIFAHNGETISSEIQALPAYEKHDEVRLPSSVPFEYQSHQYYLRLLELALIKTQKEFGPYKISLVDLPFYQSRALQELDIEDSINVYWSVATDKREEQATAIKVPLLKGLLGYRISLILKEKYAMFRRLNDPRKLQELIAAQGYDWPDYSILKHNEFNVVGISVYDSILELLHKQRVDHFPRGVEEAMREVEQREDSAITLEPKFMLYYPSYIYFFVGKKNVRLAKRIEKGLLLAHKDGSLEELFEQFIQVDEISKKVNVKNRKIIRLDNPLSTSKPLIEVKPIWPVPQKLITSY